MNKYRLWYTSLFITIPLSIIGAVAMILAIFNELVNAKWMNIICITFLITVIFAYIGIKKIASVPKH